MQSTISPVNSEVYVERALAQAKDVEAALQQASSAQKNWCRLTLEQRQQLLHKAVDHLVQQAEQIAEEITWQMGRPISQAAGEMRGLEERARFMIDQAPQALTSLTPAAKTGFNRFIQREPVGVVVIIAPWNYPFLTAVNGIIPALMAGNTVILKHSAQTPLAAERFAEAFEAADLPDGVFQFLHLSHTMTEYLIADQQVNFISFTGSVAGGKKIQSALRNSFAGLNLELGGKDPAYVRADSQLQLTAQQLVDGAFFNSGQSCCGIERIYVDKQVHDEFVEYFVNEANHYSLGNPTDKNTTLGPMVNTDAAEFVRTQVADAVSKGAKSLIEEQRFLFSKRDTPYLAPQVLINVDHSMRIMTEESFGPVIGIQAVDSDEQAIALMNDSEFGLTASVWTDDEQRALDIGAQLQTGTFFMNRCDYLDPALAWTGVKNSGRGCSLSEWGYEAVTRPKSFHLRKSLQP